MKLASPDQMLLIADRLARAADTLPAGMEAVLDRHGSGIVRRAKTITPFDKGFLVNANRYDAVQTGRGASLIVYNRMVYARRQHEIPMRHKPGKRDRYIEIPFTEEVPKIRDHLKQILTEAFE